MVKLSHTVLQSLSLCCLVFMLASGKDDNDLVKGNDDLKKPSTPKFTDCHDWWLAGHRESGVYDIFLNDTYSLKVFCNQTLTGGNTVIQRRSLGDQNFYRPYYDYMYGFGNAKGDYWAGLEAIYKLTNTGNNILRIDLQDWYGNKRYALYAHFSVQDWTQRYRLTVAHPSGTVMDDMGFQNGMQFFTYDYPDPNYCASYMKAGWWYNYCAYSLLNGIYYLNGPYTPTGGYYDGIFWKDWLGYGYSLKYTSMTLQKI